MKRTPSARVGLLVLGLLLVQIAVPTLAGANHDLPKKFHWQREENPFTLKIGDNVGTDWNQALDRAAAQWSRSKVLNLNVVPGGTNPRTCRFDSGQVEVCSENYGETGWLGITVFTVRDRHIKAAVVGLNDFYFDNPEFGLDTPRARNSVACHELGHAIGLAHRGGNSCMTVRRFPDDPDRHDYKELERIYEHLDDRTTIEGQQATALPLVAPSFPTVQDAKLQGRPEVVVEDLGNGWQQVTIIDWF